MNIQKLMQEAKKMQDNLSKKMKDFESQSFDFNYKNSISIKILGTLKITSIDINKTLIDPDDKTLLEEMVSEAVNEAIANVSKQKDDITKSAMPSMPGF